MSFTHEYAEGPDALSRPRLRPILKAAEKFRTLCKFVHANRTQLLHETDRELGKGNRYLLRRARNPDLSPQIELAVIHTIMPPGREIGA